MFGLFFDKINNRGKKTEDKPKDLSPRQPAKSPVVGSSTNTGPRINSLSPTSHHTHQYHFPQYSPQSTSTQNFFRSPNDPRKPVQTANTYTRKIDDSNTNIITCSPPGKEDLSKKSFEQLNPFKVEKPKPRPNFEFRPLDKDSFTQNLGSITESTQEGSVLAQNLPPTKQIIASKIPTKLIRKDDPFAFQTKLKHKDHSGKHQTIRF